MYYTYVLQSSKDGKFYIGFTSDLKERLNFHEKGKVKATRSRRPLKLVYYEACLSRKNAIKREKYFKTGFGRRYLNNRLEENTQARDGGQEKTKTRTNKRRTAGSV